MTPNSEVDDRVEAEPASHERRRRETPEVKVGAGFRPEVTFDDVGRATKKSVSVSGRPETTPTFPVPVFGRQHRDVFRRRVRLVWDPVKVRFFRKARCRKSGIGLLLPLDKLLSVQLKLCGQADGRENRDQDEREQDDEGYREVHRQVAHPRQGYSCL